MAAVVALAAVAGALVPADCLLALALLLLYALSIISNFALQWSEP